MTYVYPLLKLILCYRHRWVQSGFIKTCWVRRRTMRTHLDSLRVSF